MSKAYFESDRVNQSFLKKIMISPTGFVKFTKKETKALGIGSAVDCMLTTPKEYNDHFYSYNFDKANKTIMDLFKHLVKEGATNQDLSTYVDVIESYLTNIEYDGFGKSRGTFVKALEKIYKEQPLWEMLLDSEGKTLIDKDDGEIVDNCYEVFTTHEWVADIINYKKVWNQHHIEFDYRGIECKALLDKVLVNDSDKDVVFNCGIILPKHSLLIVDIKTGLERPENLNDYMMKWRIDLQLAWYYSALKWSRKDYQICNPAIAYTQTNKWTKYPIVKQLSDNELFMGRYGSYDDIPLYSHIHPEKAVFDNYGFDQAIDIYKEYEQLGNYETHWLLNKNHGLCNDYI